MISLLTSFIPLFTISRSNNLWILCHVVLKILLEMIHGGGVIHEDNLQEDVLWRPVEDGVDRAEEDGPGLVMEAHDHTCLGQIIHNTSLGLTPVISQIRQ